EVRASKLNDAAGAFEAYARAFETAPDEGEIVLQLENLAKQQQRLPELLKLIEARAAKVSDHSLQRQLLMKAAQLHENELGDVDAAVRAYGIALAQDDADEEILASVEALYRRTERWNDLLDVLRKRATI